MSAQHDYNLSSLADKVSLEPPTLSERVAGEVLLLFRMSVASTLILTGVLAVVDAAFLRDGIITPENRLITEKVVLAIIGASIVQVGAALAAIVYSLFRKPPVSEIDD